MTRPEPQFHPQETTDLPLTRAGRLYLLLIGALGFSTLFFAVADWESPNLLKYAGYLTIAVLSSGLRITVPGVTGTLSLNFLFVLIGILELTASETVVMGTLLVLIQCFWNQPRRPRPAQILFNVSAMALAVAAADWVYHSSWIQAQAFDSAIRMAAATGVLFLLNTVPMSIALTLIERRPFLAAWRECYFWALPYYLGGAAIAELARLANRFVRWETVLLMGPVLYLIYRSYRLYLDRLEEEKSHAEEVSGLHLRTIEALALAIEAKDHTTNDHLHRVQIYAMEIAKDLNLDTETCEALRAAALLHDIGKLAVPEHIISKPGKLTPEEFEKMKIHPIVGAEILERVQFPYPVVPIVRAHHEKWDGTGYPYGLVGEAIPVGARILSVVDCLDALASDRQYRRALPLEEAMQVVKSESGKAFDPRVVEILVERYLELERKAQARTVALCKLSTDLKISRGLAPAAGFELSNPLAPPASKHAPIDFLSSIGAARQEVQALFEISQELGNSLSLDETLSVLGVRLRRIIPHSALAIWMRRGDTLVPEYVCGDDFRLFSTLEIPIGHGLSGWVAANQKPILNGNPSVESGYLNDATRTSMLRSAVAVPLEGVNGVLGVLSLYQPERDAFTKDHVRILLAISSKIALSIENAVRFRQAESSATTDYLTMLPNARSLFLQLDSELSRSRRNEDPLSVAVLDLDGFKSVNDRFGHLEGNRALREVSDGLKATCREYDCVARMGGDEFVVLLAGASPADTEAKLSQFRDIVRDVCQRLFGDDSLTASIGVAHFPADGDDAEQLLAEADRRMYKEKRARKLRQTSPETLLLEEPLMPALIH
jgi:diguanylate cyclase (GGDEF)-like protein/putative nucleotidyltransferase with HDIG domain